MRNVVRWIVTGISGAVGGMISVLIVAVLMYHLLPTFFVLLLQAIPVFVASLADLWWALCVFLALLVVWAMSDEGATSPYAGPVLRGRKPAKRAPLWSGLTKSPRIGKSGGLRGTSPVSGPPGASSGVRHVGTLGPPASATGAVTTPTPRTWPTPGKGVNSTRQGLSHPGPSRIRRTRHRRI